MKRVGNLWPQIVSWQNLLDAALAAARGKRKRPDVARFLANLETNVCTIQRDLESGSYQPGEYRTFWIRDPKPRQISAAPFRDRVVHHALTRVLEPVFEPRFTTCSFASRTGYGQHLALQKAKAACASYAWHDKNSGNTTRDVKGKQPNAWGLYDMLGNVWEWVGDWYDKSYYSKSPAQDPPGPLTGTYRVLRGGSWNYFPQIVRASYRNGFEPVVRNISIGFRCAGELP